MPSMRFGQSESAVTQKIRALSGSARQVLATSDVVIDHDLPAVGLVSGRGCALAAPLTLCRARVELQEVTLS